MKTKKQMNLNDIPGIIDIFIGTFLTWVLFQTEMIRKTS